MSFFRAFFPFFNASNEVYLDTAATSQRIDTSLLAMQAYYCEFNANVHRGNYTSARLASHKYERSREIIADFLGATDPAEIIFTSGTTDAINMIVNGLNIADLQGSEILICESEHHANLLPWQRFAARYNLVLKKISLGHNGKFTQLELDKTLDSLCDRVAIVAIAHVSNALGNIFPIKEICAKAAQVGAVSIVDGTQAPAHIVVDVADLDCSFYAISGHKMYAGTGIGALFGKMEWLKKLSPSKLGGEMITHVTWDSYTLQAPPAKFEAGTPNIAGAIGLAAAAAFIMENIKRIQAYELALTRYLVGKLKPLVDSNKVVVLGNIGGGDIFDETTQAIPLLSFYVPSIHANDVASKLATQNVAVRAGHHCAMPLMQSLSIEGCVRVSLGCYSSYQDIDVFVASFFALINEDDSYDKVSNVTEQAIFEQAPQTLQYASAGQAIIGMSISEASDWNAKHRLLLIHSKNLPTLPVLARTPSTELAGCEAKVWLSAISDKNDHKQLYAYSESKVIRGILALIIERVNQLPVSDIKSLDINKYLVQVGLSHYFSVGRRDGIQQIIQRIQNEYAQ
jgi:cysteine desulfurase/selenocysteine lyase